MTKKEYSKSPFANHVSLQCTTEYQGQVFVVGVRTITLKRYVRDAKDNMVLQKDRYVITQEACDQLNIIRDTARSVERTRLVVELCKTLSRAV